MPTENDDPNRSVAFALQRTFYELQHRWVWKRSFIRSLFIKKSFQSVCMVRLHHLALMSHPSISKLQRESGVARVTTHKPLRLFIPRKNVNVGDANLKLFNLRRLSILWEGNFGWPPIMVDQKWSTSTVKGCQLSKIDQSKRDNMYFKHFSSVGRYVAAWYLWAGKLVALLVSKQLSNQLKATYWTVYRYTYILSVGMALSLCFIIFFLRKM